ncbi:hypothetical protein CHS0354_003009 [Potamilus streckersoni]|uniref:U3 small nucleolar RNA-associated protein 13 C-terminal domain-containing protein n=1 Tax=Potamilus streckersoni TaxID=2493646 RepID=A0AAE0SC20_9BIVA|nr:hypothetical protein CHS0354_003009 [Potamilus streckersoni]
MAQLKSNFAILNKFEAFYTGGNVQISNDGVYMFCGCGNKVQVLELQTGKLHLSIGQEEDEEITRFSLTPDNQYLITATQHLLLRQWNWREKILIRTWKAIHVAPVVSMAFDSTSTLLATGSADSTIKIWDIDKQYCTHNLKGHHGIISVVAFHHAVSQELRLFSAGEDYKVRVWNLQNSQCIALVEAHYSLVTSLLFSEDGSTVFSSGRDGIVAVWEASSLTVKKTIPVFENVESLVLLPEGCDFPDLNVSQDAVHFITAGSKGVLRVWNSKSSRCVYGQDGTVAVAEPEKKAGDQEQNITQSFYSKSLNAIIVVTFDHNISLFDVHTLSLNKQFSGYNDEILDSQFCGKSDSHVAVATNSPKLKVFRLDTWDCMILSGHTDIIMSISVFNNGRHFVTGSKDNTIRLWQFSEESNSISCMAVGQGHTHAVLSVSFSKVKSSFVVSGSQDCTLKLWDVSHDTGPDSTGVLHARYTEKAHDKDINSVAVSPNDRFVATGSQDKTAKLWTAKGLSLVGVMRGHKRGIWCVQFSSVDQCLATSSGDGTIKIWALTDFSCVKTFEGHDCSVLRVSFLSRGMQLLSSGSDGLIKLWTIKTNECVKTLDHHEDKIWALAVNKTEGHFLSAGADSSIAVWEDVSQKELDESLKKREEFILQEQELSNLIQQKKYLKALSLAITLEQPFRVLTIIKEVLTETDGRDKLETTLGKLRQDQIDAVLRFAALWNTNSKNCHEAQFVLSTVLRTYPSVELRKFPNIRSTLEAFIPYTERHLQRMGHLLQQSMFLEFTWQCMKSVSGGSVNTYETHGESSELKQEWTIDKNGSIVNEDTTTIEPEGELAGSLSSQVVGKRKEKSQLTTPGKNDSKNLSYDKEESPRKKQKLKDQVSTKQIKDSDKSVKFSKKQNKQRKSKKTKLGRG